MLVYQRVSNIHLETPLETLHLHDPWHLEESRQSRFRQDLRFFDPEDRRGWSQVCGVYEVYKNDMYMINRCKIQYHIIDIL